MRPIDETWKCGDLKPQKTTSINATWKVRNPIGTSTFEESPSISKVPPTMSLCQR